MEKQMAKASVKISKNYEHRHPNNHLKPRVYITHSSSFKTLVQELTGYNGAVKPSTGSAISSPPTQAGTHDIQQIKHRDQHTHNNQDDNNQDNISFLDNPWFSTCGYTDCLSFVPESSSQIDSLQDTNMVSCLLEVDPPACLLV